MVKIWDTVDDNLKAGIMASYGRSNKVRGPPVGIRCPHHAYGCSPPSVFKASPTPMASYGRSNKVRKQPSPSVFFAHTRPMSVPPRLGIRVPRLVQSRCAGSLSTSVFHVYAMPMTLRSQTAETVARAINPSPAHGSCPPLPSHSKLPPPPHAGLSRGPAEAVGQGGKAFPFSPTPLSHPRPPPYPPPPGLPRAAAEAVGQGAALPS
jgi:hypothetical protein